MSEYKATIGIECHVQLKTKTKLFAAIDNDAREATPNTLISHICLGLPGALPVLNKKAVELAVKAGFALGTEPQSFSKFDRKHYFYPDLPMGYQISQFDQPIILGGEVEIVVDGEPKKINITRAHLEADAGKNTHPAGKDYSLIDLNRAGTPLLEIVSEPEMHTPAEAKAYARELWLRMRYADVSDCDLYYGNMRFDVNVSVSKDHKTLGTRSETKNLNSFRSVERAVACEIKRQTELLEKGQPIVQETRGWDDAKQKTFSQRSKEDSHDYRYFPDPDLPPIVLDKEYVSAVRENMSVLPDDIRKRLRKAGLESSSIEALLDAMRPAHFLAECIEAEMPAVALKRIANWLVGEVQAFVAEKAISWDEIRLSHEELVNLSDMTEAGELSSTAAKTVLQELIQKGGVARTIATENNLLQVSDESAVVEIVRQVIAANPKAADDVRNGEMKAIGFLVGQVMKASKGQANPGLATKLIKREL